MHIASFYSFLRCTFLVAVLVLVGCAKEYLPPVSTARGPASAPSVAVESAWVVQPTYSYESSTGRMMAVYTNSAIGGTMFVESVPNDGRDPYEMLSLACRNAPSAHCYNKQEHGSDGRTVAAEARLISGSVAKSGAIVVRKLLGEKSRLMICTGSWATYGSSEDRAAQDERSRVRLDDLCRLRSGG